MAEDRPSYETLLDYLVYAPLGAAIVAAEEVPRLAERGRERMEKQVAVAQLIGRFAVAESRRRFGAPSTGPSGGESPRAEPDRQPTSSGGAGTRISTSPAHSSASKPESARATEVTQGNAHARSPSKAGSPSRAAPSRRQSSSSPGGAVPPMRAAESPGSDTGVSGRGLPIPAYDTLAASQVVERLPSLTPAELEAVRQHESATRRRRTVLHRIAQLNAERDGATA